MMGRDTRKAPASVSDLSPGDRICCIHQTYEEHRDLITAFIKDGLYRNEGMGRVGRRMQKEHLLVHTRDAVTVRA